ncbi:hypothetical protein RclHR1_02870008 [Rhizophagus clarus]|uniref:Amino acid transporter transmembrane domain-containing protein n=1 Tax=Rhizophagus clarus TaxID=94130 RepID=A0A2Z6R472_9GLOM|nr:hypothetical protein RclHR1_02870008 [Rhizophagus clarus]
MICGQSKITFIGAISLLVSEMIGPGLVTIPILFESAGLITPLIMFGVALMLACSSALLLVEALSSIPGNEKFEKKIEYISLFSILIDNRIIRMISYFILFLSIESMIIATIALTSQAFDAILVRFFGSTCGIGLYPDKGWICVQNLNDFISPFGNRLMFVTGGFMITFVLVIPMAICNLGENVKIQILSFISLIFVIITWIIACIMNGLNPDRIPVIGNDQSLLVGTVLFNYAFIITVPSMNQDVSIRKVVWMSVGITSLAYILIGLFGAMAFHYDLASNLISEIRKSKIHNVFTDIATLLFPFCGLLASIPVDTIVFRYNLIRSEVCNYPMATFISLVIPWCIALPFQTGFWLNTFTNWTSLLFISTANFLIPFCLFHQSQKKAKILQTLELAKEAASSMNESNEENKNIDDKKNKEKDYFAREPIISLPPPPPPLSSNNSPEEEKEKSAFQKHLERHLQKLEKQKLENPQLEKLKRAKVYRNMSADAVPIDELPDIILKKNVKKNDSLSSNNNNDDDVNNNNIINNNNNVFSPGELYESNEADKTYIPSHPSTPRSVSTDDEEFYSLFNYVKPFKAFPGTSKKFSMIVSYSAASVSIILISSVIIYDFIGLAHGKNFFDSGSN